MRREQQEYRLPQCSCYVRVVVIYLTNSGCSITLLRMAYGPRLDAPGVLHHVMARGIERRDLFQDDVDRREFLLRLEAALRRTGASVYAWALIPNHVHLLVRSGWAGVGRMMQGLLGGYARRFNRRHQRSGHLLQNRFKSLLVEEEPYLLELVRYIHLNPVRAGLVDAGGELDRYPWTGHARLMGEMQSPWQDTTSVLNRFAATTEDARRHYRTFVSAGVAQGRRHELSEGRRVRWQPEGWQQGHGLGRGRERWAFDERILGTDTFVGRLLEQVAEAPPWRPRPRNPSAFVRTLAQRTAAHFGLSASDLLGQRWRNTAARAVVCHVAVHHARLPLRAVARGLGVSAPTVLRGVRRGAKVLAERGLNAHDLLG